MSLVNVSSTSRKLCQLYKHLRSHFGYAHPWWPGEPLEVAVTAILVQQCDWSAAWKAVLRLREHELLSLPALAGAKSAVVQSCIQGVAFGPTKAKRLIGFARAVLDDGYVRIEAFLSRQRDIGRLRSDLLAFPGIGAETADSMMLFASEHPCFVIDAYTRRIMARLGLFPELDQSFWLRQSYRRLQDFFEENLLLDFSLYDDLPFANGVPRPVALFRDFHAQLVELGKHHCLKTGPRCLAVGRRGWTNYALCEPHCLTTACQRCPLAGCCRTARRPEVV